MDQKSNILAEIGMLGIAVVAIFLDDSSKWYFSIPSAAVIGLYMGFGIRYISERWL